MTHRIRSAAGHCPAALRLSWSRLGALLSVQVADDPLGDARRQPVLVMGGDEPLELPVVGHQQETFGVLIQTTDGVDPLGVPDEIYDVVPVTMVTGAGDPTWLVENEDYVLLDLGDGFAIDTHVITIEDLVTHDRCTSVDGYTALFDKAICSPAGCHPGFADELVETCAL